ncbi:Dyp-type peroxidase [Parasulfitobacter algicola]|uniref:Peroxidase n=1 Tax=Parasulfitobacter algicola TaxID=2614809 RepID=A0ABX2IW31_9RHOB|nr:peroxidase [Sulfitobacter algicola]NSX54609.1 peroxidase [Sulfitobacter algicola]
MTRSLNLDDIQGNVTRAYGRFSFPFARYFFLHIANCEAGRNFVDIVRRKVTTSARWPEQVPKPDCTLNIGFTAKGLMQLQLPSRTLNGMPDEFIQGMKARAFVLGDRDATKTEAEDTGWDDHWDPIWKQNRSGDSNDVHIWVSMNAQLKTPGTTDPVDALEDQTNWLRGVCHASKGGVRILATNGRNGDQEYQAASAIFEDHNGAKIPTPKEHFGFTDGISDPVFEGQYRPDEMPKAVIGRGKRVNGKWEPIAAGEFILGHPDESQESPPTSVPPEFMRNGTFMAYRKLHENVETFNTVLTNEAKRYAKEMNVSLKEANETLRAKMCGRWSDGVPLSKVSTYPEWQKFRTNKGFDDPDPLTALAKLMAYVRSPEAMDFRFADDMEGTKCPVGAHIRRVNTRDYLDPLNKVGIDPKTGKPHTNEKATSALNKRRRILRRGLPYGPPNFDHVSDDVEQGVAMMLMGTSLFRQFEFVQQQWIEYGLDFHQGNNTCPLLGNHDHHPRHTIPADPASGKPPYVMSKLKTFVECRGGDYFFIPSMTALRMIAMGIVDPT